MQHRPPFMLANPPRFGDAEHALHPERRVAYGFVVRGIHGHLRCFQVSTVRAKPDMALPGAVWEAAARNSAATSRSQADADVRRGRQVGVRRPRNSVGDLCQRPERTLDTRSQRPVRGVHWNVMEAAPDPVSLFGEMLRTLP